MLKRGNTFIYFHGEANLKARKKKKAISLSNYFFSFFSMRRMCIQDVIAPDSEL